MKLLSLIFLLLLPISLVGQNLVINELAATNDSFEDIDGDKPDWIEIRNISTEPIDLEGWRLSDDENDNSKWVFPKFNLSPSEHLLVWCSGKDRKLIDYNRTLISLGDTFNYLVPDVSTSSDWFQPGFDDSLWLSGPSGFGFGDFDDSTQVATGTRSIYIRKKFTLASLDEIESMLLDIDYDDAFVAYLNGNELVRENINGTPPAYNQFSIVDHEAQIFAGGKPDRYVFTNILDHLVQGENVLAIQVHNFNASSTDLTLIPFLSLSFSENISIGIKPPAILDLINSNLHTNFKISSESDNVYLFDPNGNLIDEVTVDNFPRKLSFGRSTTSSNKVFFSDQTPGEINSGEEFIDFISDQIIFSNEGGLTQIFDLTLTGAMTPAVIRYTLGGSEPNESSAIYSAPIPITQSKVVRAKIYRDGYYPSPIFSRSFILNQNDALPIVSLITEPDNFFHPDTGMYVLGTGYTGGIPYFGSNIWEEWERPIHFSFYEPDGTLGIEFNGGTKIFGGWSRSHDQRSLSLFARSKYGAKSIEYPFFEDNNVTNFEALVLRNSGNDWQNTQMRDITLTSLMEGSGVDYQQFRTVSTYLNGSYWGMYNIREKVNEHFLANKHNLDPDDISILQTNADVVHGTNADYVQLLNFINANSLINDANYFEVTKEVDIDNFIKYNVAQIYFDNTDWPGNNIKYWKASGGKWRWILYDTDFGFGIWNSNNWQNNTISFALQANGQNWPNPSWATFMLRNLMKNISFRNQFVNQFADELNSRFVADNVTEHIDSIQSVIGTEINKHLSRWGGSFNYWSSQVSNMKQFAELRPDRIRLHIKNQFNFPSIRTINFEIDDLNEGYVEINSLTIKETSWSGKYFEGVPIEIRAVAKPGYTFIRWIGEILPTDPVQELNLTKNVTLTPLFKANDAVEGTVLINEIKYETSSPLSSGDWIELHNTSASPVDLSGWNLNALGSNANYEFPVGTFIDSKGYLVLSQNLEKFKQFWPTISPIEVPFSFDLSRTEESLRLYNGLGNLEDEVDYTNGNSWPTVTENSGSSIELLEPLTDNNIGGNWMVINEAGSPAGVNEVFEIPVFPSGVSELVISPNPFVDNTKISFKSGGMVNFSAEIFASNGALIGELFNAEFEIGEHLVETDLSDLAKGTYLIKFKLEEETYEVLKWIKVQ